MFSIDLMCCLLNLMQMYLRNRRWYILYIIYQCNRYIIMNRPAHRLHDLLFSGDSFVVGFLRYLHHCFREQDISLHPRAVCGSDFICYIHEDVVAWKRFPHNWPFVNGMHRFTVDSSHKGLSMRSFYVFFVAVPSKQKTFDFGRHETRDLALLY